MWLIGPASDNPGASVKLARVPRLKHYPISSEDPFTAILEADRNRFRSDEAAFTHDQFDAAVFVAAEMDLHQIFDHIPLPPLDACHVRRNRAGIKAELHVARGERL